MGIRSIVSEHVSSLLAFGHVVGSAVLSTAKSVVLTVRGDEDPDGDEELSGCEVYGQAPLLYRPKDPTNAGQMEALVIRDGDERVVIATKDRRFQVEPAQGEVRVVALGVDGSRQAQVILKPNGVLVLKGVRIEIGDEGASETIGLGTAIKSHFDSIKNAFDNHTHAYVDDGAAVLTSPPNSAAPPTPATALTFAPTPDVESRHRVEN